MLERLQFRFFRRAGVIVVQTSLYGAGLAPTPEKVPTLKPCFLCGTGRLSVSSGSRETCAAENQRDRKVTQYKSIVNLNHAARDFFCSCLSERYLHRAAAGSFRDSQDTSQSCTTLTLLKTTNSFLLWTCWLSLFVLDLHWEYLITSVDNARKS